MKILVCIKQVMESASRIRISDSGQWTKYSDNTRFEINNYDEYAIEEAIRIKENMENAHIDVITAGPSRAADALRRAMGMGADNAVHIIDETLQYRGPATTAAWIADAAENRNYDLIFTGIMSSDEMNGQTGPMIARILGLPCATAVIRAEIAPDQKQIFIEREIEGGAKDAYLIKTPCVLTIQTGINSPRYPALSKVLRAKKKTIEQIPADTLATGIPAPVIHDLRFPEKKTSGLVLDGSPQEKADQLIDVLAAGSFL